MGEEHQSLCVCEFDQCTNLLHMYIQGYPFFLKIKNKKIHNVLFEFYYFVRVGSARSLVPTSSVYKFPIEKDIAQQC